MAKIHFCSTHIAGFSYWEGAKIFSKLKIWQKLLLLREKNNNFDAYAVAIYYKNYKLGYLPRSENREIAKFLDAWYQKIFSVRINQISPNEHPEQQLGITIKISIKK